MADTTFTDGVTLTAADWFNDVNRLHYTIFGDPANTTAAFTAIKQPATDTSTGVVEYAVQSEMETATSNTLVATPGRMQYHPGVAKAWARWDSATSAAGFAGYNVSTTVTKNATGSYTLRFLTNFSSTTAYNVLLGADDTGSVLVGSVSTRAISTCTIVFRASSGTLTDANVMDATFFGDQ